MFLKKFLRKKINLHNFVFEVTSQCNQGCLYCYNVWKSNKYPRKEMNLDDWKTIIQKLKDETQINRVSISGGEPLLYSHIFELVKYVHSQGLKINLLTNGVYITEEKAARLIESGVDLFEIPLIAPDRKLHKELKQIDDFDKVIEGIANLHESEINVVTVFVATSKNIDHIEETLDLAVALGSDSLMFNRVNPSNERQINMMPSKKQIKKALEYLNDFSGKYKFPISCSIPMPPCVIDMRNYHNLTYGYCPSGNHKSYYTIDFCGNVRMCNHSPHIIGNLLEEDFNQIIQKNYVENFRKVLPKDCRQCKFIEECRGGCKAASEVCYSDLGCKDPFAKKFGDKDFI